MPKANGEDRDSASATTYLIPKMGEFAVSNTAFYTSLYITELDGAGAEPTPLERPIDPFEELGDAGAGADRPAVGVLLTHEQGWFQKGLALGELLHSLCLAPGEVTKVAVVDWQRRTSAQDDSATTAVDRVSAESEQNLGASEVQRTQARERQAGRSTSAAVSSQSQAGGSFGFFGSGVSASTSLATSLGHSASVSTGSRDLSAESTREVSQRTEQLSQAVRSRRSTQVREVSETETSNVSTRVVANYNRQHAMTVQYYEVLQVYELKTRVAKAERCLFVPMKVTDFTEKTTLLFRETLMAIAADLGLDDLRQRLQDYEKDVVQSSPALERLETDAKRLRDELGQRQQAISTHDENGKRLIAEKAAAIGRAASNPLRPDLIVAAVQEHAAAVSSYARERASLVAALGATAARLGPVEARAAQLRAAMGVSKKELIEFMRRDRLVLNQLMWMRLDKHRVHRLLARHSFRDQPLGGLVDPEPVGVFGNYVAFRWHFDDDAEATGFVSEFVRDENEPIVARVVLPSEGVFAEAVLGQSNAAEKIDVTRFWDWNASPIPILPPGIAPVDAGSRARDIAMPDGKLEASIAALPALQALPGSDLGAILSAVQSGSMFRNMSGLEGTVSLAATLAENSSRGAAEAGKTALEAQKAYSDAMVSLANSEAGKAAMQLAMTAVPGGKAATVLGGLMNAGSSVAGGTAGGAGGGNGAAAPSGTSGSSGTSAGRGGRR